MTTKIAIPIIGIITVILIILAMGLSKKLSLGLFKKHNNEEIETTISSSRPYEVYSDNIGDGEILYRTFTGRWDLEAEREIKSAAKIGYSDENLYRLDLYLPGRKTIREANSYINSHEEAYISLWIFLDNGEFFIVFPQESFMAFDPDEEVAHYTMPLSQFGFHSQKKRLQEIYTPEEICNFVLDNLMNHDIVEIEPHIVSPNDDAPKCATVNVNSPTANTIRKAVDAITAARTKSMK